MDFGWKKPDPVSQDDKKDESTIDKDSTPPIDEDSSTPKADKEAETDAKPEGPGIGTDFSVSQDDSFGDDASKDLTLETPEAEEIENMNETAEIATPEKVAAEDTEEPRSSVREDSKFDESEDRETREEPEETEEPEEIDEETPASMPVKGSMSLPDFESKIKAEKEEVDKQVAELQAKVTKLDDLLTKISKMLQDEQSLIQEISSAIE